MKTYTFQQISWWSEIKTDNLHIRYEIKIQYERSAFFVNDLENLKQKPF